jgi:hypothetical protein
MESALRLIRWPVRIGWVLALSTLLGFAGANISEAGSPQRVPAPARHRLPAPSKAAIHNSHNLRPGVTSVEEGQAVLTVAHAWHGEPSAFLAFA